MEDGGRDRLGDEHDAVAEAGGRLAQHAGAHAAPVGRVGEHEQVDLGAAGHPAGLADRTGQHGPDHVADPTTEAPSSSSVSSMRRLGCGS